MFLQWEAIPNSEKSKFAGVTGLCINPQGQIIGSLFPEDVFDSNMFEIREKFRVTGDKCGFQRTDVMLEFPFPEIEGEKFIPEAVVWYRIAKKYKTRFFNDILRIVKYRSDGYTVAGLRLLIENPKGKLLFFNECMTMPLNLKTKFKVGANYVCSSLHARLNFAEILRSASRPSTALIAFPLGFLLYYKDLRFFNKEK